MSSFSESEWETRKTRIDQKLRAAGWKVQPHASSLPTTSLDAVAVEEYPTSSGPADYALWVKGCFLGAVEAKKIAVNPQEVLGQAKRYSRTATDGSGLWEAYKVPFLYSTNGEKVLFLDVRQSQNLRREVSGFHTPAGLEEWFTRTHDADYFTQETIGNGAMRPYQREAIGAIETAMTKGQRALLVAMATGTGKTFTTVSQIYRALESKNFKRILFLVDRRALAAQAVREFGSYETPGGRKFNQEYDVFHQQFRREDMEDPDSGQKFDPKVLPNSHLVTPGASHTFVYVSTIQRMAINLFGQGAVFEGEGGEGEAENDAAKLDIPIHAFDLIIADECHRGYTGQQMGLWQRVIRHFDCIKIGLTATPAAHTVSLFDAPVFEYAYEKAVEEGYLCDYEAVTIESGVLMNGAFLKEGEAVTVRDRATGKETTDYLEDEREFETTKIEREITVPDTNRKIVRELKKYALEHEAQTGRFPKVLIFAANDAGHASHADQVVKLCREEFARGDDFAIKITGNANVDRPLQRIREFRNRPQPKIVVSVDMLSTGVDIPALEWIVFLRPIKSRILWEQMLGRGTRKCKEIQKSHFTIFDCFGGSLIRYFKDASNMEAEPKAASLPLDKVIENIWRGFEKPYHVKVLVKRLQRIAKEMTGPAYAKLEAFGIPGGDLSAWAPTLPDKIKNDFKPTLDLLRDPLFQQALKEATQHERQFLIAIGQTDTVTSEVLFRVGDKELRPVDYLATFSQWVKDNPDHLAAIEILQARPRDWNPAVLDELRKTLTRHAFDEEKLEKATRLTRGKTLADIISLVKHAANEASPLFTATERVDLAFSQISQGKTFTPQQQVWIERIREHLIKNLSMEMSDFEMPVFKAFGLQALRMAFPVNTLQELVADWNTALAA